MQSYGHDENDEDAGSQLQRFSLRTSTVNLLLRQGAIGPAREGAWGISFLSKDYAATGPQALTPPAESRGIGAFGFQEIGLGAGGVALQIGGRLDGYRIASHTNAAV